MILKLQGLQESRGCVQSFRLDISASFSLSDSGWNQNPIFSLEEVYLCLIEMLAWRQMGTGEILMTTRFSHVNLL